MKKCNICGSTIKKFYAYNGGSSNLSEFIKKMKVVGSDVDNFGCPKCNSHDRERHLLLYLEKTNLLKGRDGLRILHFAPENAILPYLSNFNPEIHILADIYTKDERYQRIDIEKIPYSNDTFDLIIANHVLEHVTDPISALTEINRVLCDEGFAILQTPYSELIENTFQDNGINSNIDRLFFYGDENHARLFGRNIFSLYGNYLSSNVLQHKDLFGDGIAEAFGVNQREPFFLYRKKKLVISDTALKNESNTETLTLSPSPAVSVCCLAYNHENFIEKTLYSILNQKTNFSFEIVIGEDCSTDRTREIIEKIKCKYPDKLSLLTSEENLGPYRNLLKTMRACNGKYIAICDGDDYWTDSYKLQKQFFYLEHHPNCSVSYGAVQAHIDGHIDYNYIGGLKCDLTNQQLIQSPPLNTLTVMFRNVINPLPPEILTAGAADLFLWSLLGWHGSGYFDSTILPSIYNIHKSGIHSTTSLTHKLLMRIRTMYSLFLYYKRVGHESICDFFHDAVVRDIKLVMSSDTDSSESLLNDLPSNMKHMAGSAFDFDQNTITSIIQSIVRAEQP